CWSSVCLRGLQRLWRFFSLAAYGSQNGAPRGSGNFWFRSWRRSGSPGDAQAEPGALTRCWHSGDPPLPGGDERSWCACRSLFLHITRRRRLATYSEICLSISSLRSSLSTATRPTEHPIWHEKWEPKSSRSLAEDTGARV